MSAWVKDHTFFKISYMWGIAPQILFQIQRVHTECVCGILIET